MDKHLMIGLFLLLAACGGDGGGISGNDALPTPTQPEREGPPPLIPDTPQAEVPPISAKGWQFFEPGTLVEAHPVNDCLRLSGAAHTVFVRYTTVDVHGNLTLASGLVMLPEQPQFAEGEWPLVVYGHMTTGVADACAPSHASADSTELQKMQQGDEIARQLLSRGVAVARPDYEGLGEPGPHPYLRGDSLAQAMRDMASAVAGHWDKVGDYWVAAGHSEGGVAALNSGSRLHPEARDLTLVGVVSVTPVTQLENLVLIAEALPITGLGINEAVALAALVAHGITTVDPDFKRLLLEEGGLSERALALWPDLERLCLGDLSRPESWGGLPPNQLKGPKGDEAAAEIRRALAADDVRHLPMRFDVPIRIDVGIFDLVAHLPYAEQLVATYRDNGYDVDYYRWPAAHSPTADMAAGSIADWILERFY